MVLRWAGAGTSARLGQLRCQPTPVPAMSSSKQLHVPVSLTHTSILSHSHSTHRHAPHKLAPADATSAAPCACLCVQPDASLPISALSASSPSSTLDPTCLAAKKRHHLTHPCSTPPAPVLTFALAALCNCHHCTRPPTAHAPIAAATTRRPRILTPRYRGPNAVTSPSIHVLVTPTLAHHNTSPPSTRQPLR